MQINIYQRVMPVRREARRAGHDFFVCKNKGNIYAEKPTLEGFYFIPVSGNEVF